MLQFFVLMYIGDDSSSGSSSSGSDSGSDSSSDSEDEPNIIELKFRNYQPRDKDLSKLTLPKASLDRGKPVFTHIYINAH